jgi:aspartyl-tRNA synthetase
MLKTHNCGQLRTQDIGQTVVLAGWVNRRRDLGGLIFIDLRDRDGITQAVANPEVSLPAFEMANTVRNEYVLQVEGTVRRRPAGMENPDMPTGAIEVVASRIAVLNSARTPPILINREEDETESLRLKYRYLDLRRARMQRNMLIRHRAVKFIRDFLTQRGFIEIETPILFKSTPEGARDYLVPSRVHPGKFYALPQSPQQLKQLLMVAGFERYFQIARCFRDEDQRADRQPEFTQLDLEMSFVEREDILQLTEALMIGMVGAAAAEVTGKRVRTIPFPRLTHEEALERYGTDRPDLRYGLELINLSEIAGQSDFNVFRDAVAGRGVVKGMRLPGCGEYSRKQVTDLESIAKDEGAKGLAWIALRADGTIRSPVAKFFAEATMAELLEAAGMETGDLLLMVADAPPVANAALSAVRQEMARQLELIDPSELAFAWVIDFPLFEWNEAENRWDPSHHLFTSPQAQDIPLLNSDPAAVKSNQYDLVCNGYEVGGGSIRIHQRELQEQIMELIGLTVEEARDQFGHLLEAFEYGTPPHGGIAPGIDRLTMLLAGEPNIREVIAFPKSQNAADLMASAPSAVEPGQLKELHIRLDLESERS